MKKRELKRDIAILEFDLAEREIKASTNKLLAEYRKMVHRLYDEIDKLKKKNESNASYIGYQNSRLNAMSKSLAKSLANEQVKELGYYDGV